MLLYPYNGIFGNKNEWCTDSAMTLMSLKNIIVSERSQFQNTTHCMIQLIWNVPKDKFIETENRLINGCLGLGRVEMGMTIMVKVSFWSNKNVLKLDYGGGYRTLDTLKTIELYILSRWFVCHIYYVPIKF